jgi:hypothetical protein
MIKAFALLFCLFVAFLALPTFAQDATMLPRDGRWTITFDDETFASCLGMTTSRLDTNELFPQMTLAARVASIEDHFTINGTSFSLTGDGEYVGFLRWHEDHENVQLFLQVETATRMTGRLVITFPIEAFRCSSTTALVMTRR